MTRVFVIEPPTVNIDAAQKWGEIEILFETGAGVTPLDSQVYAGLVIEALEEREFNPKSDMILIVGPIVGLSVGIASIISRFRAVKGLLYQPSNGEYILRTLGKWQYIKKYKRHKSERAS